MFVGWPIFITGQKQGISKVLLIKERLGRGVGCLAIKRGFSEYARIFFVSPCLLR